MSEKYDIYYEKPKDDYQAYEDTSFVSGDSPKVLDPFTDLGRTKPAYLGEILCDGAGDILVAVSSDGTTYGGNRRVKAGETLYTKPQTVNKVKITHSGTDSAWRAVFQ